MKNSNYSNSNNSSKVIGALMVGTLVGAAVGLLFAPHKGSKTRQNIANGTKDLANSAKDLTNDLRHKANSSFNDLKNQAKSSYNDLTNKAETVTNNVDSRASNFSKDFNQNI